MEDGEINYDEIEERLRSLSSKQLLEFIENLLQNDTLTYERRQEILKICAELKSAIDEDNKKNTEFYRKNWPEAVTKINKLLESDSFTDEEKEQLREISATMSGYLCSFWLPRGIIRKILMFVSFAIGILGIFQWSLWLLFFILLGCCFSPRIIGEISYFIGKLQSG